MSVKPYNTRTRYSVWRNEDDRLMILDGTASECAKRMGTTRQFFYVIVNKGGNQIWTITKKSVAEIEAESREGL